MVFGLKKDASKKQGQGLDNGPVSGLQSGSLFGAAIQVPLDVNAFGLNRLQQPSSAVGLPSGFPAIAMPSIHVPEPPASEFPVSEPVSESFNPMAFLSEPAAVVEEPVASVDSTEPFPTFEFHLPQPVEMPLAPDVEAPQGPAFAEALEMPAFAYEQSAPQEAAYRNPQEYMEPSVPFASQSPFNELDAMNKRLTEALPVVQQLEAAGWLSEPLDSLPQSALTDDGFGFNPNQAGQQALLEGTDDFFNQPWPTAEQQAVPMPEFSGGDELDYPQELDYAHHTELVFETQDNTPELTHQWLSPDEQTLLYWVSMEDRGALMGKRDGQISPLYSLPGQPVPPSFLVEIHDQNPTAPLYRVSIGPWVGVIGTCPDGGLELVSEPLSLDF